MDGMSQWLGRASALATVAVMALALVIVGGPGVTAQQATPAVGQCPGGATPVASAAATSGAQSAAIPNATPIAGRCVTVGMFDIYFDPNKVTIPADTPVTFVLSNHGAIPHDFAITDHNNPNVPNLNVFVLVQPGQTQTVTLQAPAGTYYFYCTQPGHEQAGMFGYLVVQPGAQISAERATVTPPAG